MNVKEIVAAIKAEKPEITSVYFVGCGASQSDLYPGKYFLEANARKLRTSLHTANEFVYSTPAAVGPDSIVITCSLSGGTPETVEATKKAMSLGAEVIAVTIDENSALAKAAKYQIIHGFYKDYAVDGDWGKGTTNAINRWRKANGWSATGTIGTKALKKLLSY